MNRKKSGWLYLIIACISIAISLVLTVMHLKTGFELEMIPNIFLSEAMLIVPTFFMLLFGKDKVKDVLSIRKIKWSTFFGVIAFTMAASPLVTLINLASQLFVENTVSANSDQFLSLHPVLLIFFVGMLAPVCEEVVFRGAIFGGMKKEGNVFKAIIASGLLFGLLHMNINQASYAFVIGVLLGFLVEATGSIFSSILFHVLVNSTNAVMMIISDSVVSDEMMDNANEIVTTATLLNMIGVYVVLAVIGTTIAICLLVWMSKNEGRQPVLVKAWQDRKVKEGKVISIPFVIGVVISILFMLLEFIPL
ncbi:MAG: CPBP family intramembrane metalloprotease [Lachnospiraceae bacterium]|nr:CPBP family intramembrane metalloprotease [Lachnospiraceae bacterium]